MLFNEQRIMLALGRAEAELKAIKEAVPGASSIADAQNLLKRVYDVRPSIDVAIEALNDAKDRVDSD